jgi:hypothetical protein
MRQLTFLFAVASLAACTSTYHPEYHPVTATTITQTYSSPMAVGAAVQRPIVVAPAPPPPVIVQTPPSANPDEFFDTSYR